MYGKEADYKEFIDYRELLQQVNQLHVWWWILGRSYSLYESFCNPLRVDHDPGCWLSWGVKKKRYIVLNDFGDKYFHGWTIFDAVMYLQRLKGQNCSFRNACHIIKNQFGPSLTNGIIQRDNSTEMSKIETHLSFEARVMDNGELYYASWDKEFWEPFHISSDNLKEDHTFSVTQFRISSKRTNGNLRLVFPRGPCYAFLFPSGRIKLYQPYEEVDKGKFITTCINSDIGGVEFLPETGDILIVTKGYKEYRILRNLGWNTVWVQNEHVILPDDIVIDWYERFKRIIIFYDNDNSGIKGAIKCVEECNTLISDEAFQTAWLPEHLKDSCGIKDIPEFFVKHGDHATINQIEELIL